MPARAKTATEGNMRLPLHRSLAISLALCAMVLRALLPDGWMPNMAAGAGAPFIICSADGGHMGGKTPAAPTPERSHAPCAFAAAAPLAPPAFAALVIAASHDATHLAAAFVQDSPAIASAHRPNAARAPPAFS
jgi:hypothetical protein